MNDLVKSEYMVPADKHRSREQHDTMSTGTKSKTVQSNQVDVHPHLLTILERRKERAFLAPIKKHTADAFASLMESLDDKKPIVLDAGCGTGYSSMLLAEQYPNCTVIGIDRSQARLEKGLRRSFQEERAMPTNCHLLRADCVDFWRLLLKEQKTLSAHYLLYPNPYPKKRHLLRRWHAHPVFPTLLDLGGTLRLRTNWDVYAKEFAKVLQYYQRGHVSLRVIDIENTLVLSPFEEKYRQSGHTLYEVAFTPQPVAPHSDD